MSETPAPAVLLVEDDPTNQLIALSMLRHLGIEADAAPNGQVGVSMALGADYDVVLMDIQMPVMDGVEAMRSIRALLPPDRCPRIVAVTAHAVSGTRERLVAAGFDGFYNKPLSIALLEEALAAPPPAPAAFVARPAAARAGAAPDARARLMASVRDHVREMLGEDDDDFAHELVASFAASTREAVAEAQAACQAHDVAAAAAAAHKLKGGASNVGFDDLTEAWGAIEVQVRRGAGLAEVSAPLDAAIDQTERTLALLAA